jgi:hypothetical protein
MEYGGRFNDNGATIEGFFKTAYNDFGNGAFLKQLTLLRPNLKLDPNYKAQICFDTDFKNRYSGCLLAGQITTGSLWNVSPWNTSSWAVGAKATNDTYASTALGHYHSVRVTAQQEEDQMEAFTLNYVFKPGGAF